MPFGKTEIYQMDRRSLLKLTGAMGIGATFVNPQELFAAGGCDQILIDNGDFEATQAGAKLQFWIDGILFGGRSSLSARANITLFMPLTQTEDSYVESVVLMDAGKKTLGARFFDPSMKMYDSDYVPYVRFENLELDSTKDYYCVYTVKTGNDVKLYTATISKPVPSALKEDFLPQKMKNDFKAFLVGGDNPTPGLFTTQFQYYTKNGLGMHTARGRVQSIGSNGDFTINIDFMHADYPKNPKTGAYDHFMRYFIVMDPVGRILGVRKRESPEDNDKGVVKGKYTAVSKVDEATKTLFAIDPQQIADIRDCPYIQFFTEDSYDALARNMIRMR